MTNESSSAYQQLLYLLKIFTGLAVLVAVILTAFWLPLSGDSAVKQYGVLVVLLLVTIALVPFVRWVYFRTDELQQLLHKKASVTSLAIIAAVSCLLGILQANQLVPMFNQFWTLGVVVAVWGINLMLADRSYR